jgi:transcriptional regulator with XRE-family HTH domain
VTTADVELYQEIGRRLRALRGGMSLRDVEEKSAGRWKGPTVRSWERGSRTPAIHAILGLAGFYGTPPETLVPGFEGPDVPVSAVLGVLHCAADLERHCAELRAAVEPEGVHNGSVHDAEVTP